MAAERTVYPVVPTPEVVRWTITRETDDFIEEHGTRAGWEGAPAS